MIRSVHFDYLKNSNLSFLKSQKVWSWFSNSEQTKISALSCDFFWKKLSAGQLIDKCIRFRKKKILKKFCWNWISRVKFKSVLRESIRKIEKKIILKNFISKWSPDYKKLPSGLGFFRCTGSWGILAWGEGQQFWFWFIFI